MRSWPEECDRSKAQLQRRRRAELCRMAQVLSNTNFQHGFNLIYNRALGRALRRIFNRWAPAAAQ